MIYPGPLPPEEQIALCVLAQGGDLKARNTLLASHMGLVRQYAYKYRGLAPYSDPEDVAMEAVFALNRAIEKFEPERGYKFLTYATWWIKQGVRNAAFLERGMKRGDVSCSHYVKAYQGLRSEGLSVREAREAIAKKYGASLKVVIRVLNAFHRPRPYSLDATLNGGGEASWGEKNGLTLIETYPDGRPSAEDDLCESSVAAAIRTVVARFRVGLTDREKRILDARIMADPQMTLRDLGAQLGISFERVRQLEVRVRSRLRTFCLYAPELKDVLPDPSASSKLPDWNARLRAITRRQKAQAKCAYCKHPPIQGMTMCPRHRKQRCDQNKKRARAKGVKPVKLRLITFRGQALPMRAWARKMGLLGTCVAYRLQKGWSVERALTTPSKRSLSPREAAAQ